MNQVPKMRLRLLEGSEAGAVALPIALCVMLALALTSCTTPNASVDDGPPPAPAADVAEQDGTADALAAALQDSLCTESLANEPESDLGPEGPSGLGRYYVSISAVSDSPPSITLDVGQLHLGSGAFDPAADDVQPDQGWTSNAYEHVETVPVTSDVVVILQNTHGQSGDTVHAGLIVLGFEEFVRRFEAGGERLEDAGYIVTFGEEGIRSIVQVYFP